MNDDKTRADGRTQTTIGALAAPDGDALPRGTRIGPFVLEGLLGRGGMGEVYRAMQLEPFVRTVAVKLIRERRLSARQLALFEVERQVLAQMSHPSIAAIFDAGATDDGQPWFAMEYVEGPALTSFCDQHRLDLRGRLALFARVCRGVQHAHQKGVVHRDLKPSNILVTMVDGLALPKIIDFGIAAAAVRCLQGGADDPVGTPDYMSPEQAGETPFDVDTRSDVYSLGVVLHELLVGRRPTHTRSGERAATGERTLALPSHMLARESVDARGRLAALRRIAPRRLADALRHDLDWVVRKATSRERDARYDSVSLLADEIERFLEHRPLAAVPQSRTYTLRRFARRHRLGIAVAGLAISTLVVGLAAALYGFWQADQQRRIAEQRTAELARVSAFQQSMLEDIDLPGMGQRLSRLQREQHARAIAIAEPNPQRRAEAEAAFAQALSNTSPTDTARALIGEDILARALSAIDRDFAEQPLLAGDLRQAVGELYISLGLFDRAASTLSAEADARVALLGDSDPRTLETQGHLGFAINRLGRTKDAEILLRAALERAVAAQGEDGTQALALAHSLGLNFSDQGRADEAVVILARAVEGSARRHGDSASETLDVRTSLGIARIRTGERAAARDDFAAVLDARRRTLGDEHPTTISSISNLAGATGMLGHLDQALALQREGYALNRRVRGDEHPATLADGNNLGSTLVQLGEADEAVPILRTVLDARRRVLGPDHPQTLRTMLNLAGGLQRLGAHEDARAMQSDLLARRERTLGPAHQDTVGARAGLASMLIEAGDLEGAEALIREVRRQRSALPERHPDRIESDDLLAHVLLERGRPETALPLAEGALAIAEANGGPEHPATISAALTTWRILHALGRDADASALEARLFQPLLTPAPETLSPMQLRQRERITQRLAQGWR